MLNWHALLGYWKPLQSEYNKKERIFFSLKMRLNNTLLLSRVKHSRSVFHQKHTHASNLFFLFVLFLQISFQTVSNIYLYGGFFTSSWRRFFFRFVICVRFSSFCIKILNIVRCSWRTPSKLIIIIVVTLCTKLFVYNENWLYRKINYSETARRCVQFHCFFLLFLVYPLSRLLAFYFISFYYM